MHDLNNPAAPDTSDPAAKPSTPVASHAEAAADIADRPDILGRVVKGVHEAVDGAASKVVPIFDGVAKAQATRGEWVGATRETIQTHPFPAVATAFLVGVAYASLRSPGRR